MLKNHHRQWSWEWCGLRGVSAQLFDDSWSRWGSLKPCLGWGAVLPLETHGPRHGPGVQWLAVLCWDRLEKGLGQPELYSLNVPLCPQHWKILLCILLKKNKFKKSCSLLPILASQGWRQSLPQCLRSCQLCEPGHCLLYVMPKFILWICHLSSSSSDGLGAAVRVSEVPVQLPRAAPAAAPLLTRALAAGAARLSGDQLLGNWLRCQDRHCTAGSRQARLVTVIKSSKIQNMLSSVRNKEQLKFH